MIKYIEKRDGSIAKFNPKNIYNAVYQSAKSCNEFVDVDNVVRLVIERLEKRNQPTINIEIVQDEVEFVLMGLGYFKAAKSYITYRNMRDAQRNLSLGNINAESSVEEYLSRADWRVNANANQGYSLGGMILNVAGKVTANYWLNKIYPKEIGQAHRNGDIHIHDLDMLSIYCCGWSLKNVLREGMNGIAGKIESNPPKHLSSALNQALNHLCCCFTGDTKIWKADGSTITFQECLDQNIKELDVLSYNEKTGKVVKSRMTDIGVYKEVDELIELDFAFGDTIKCTPDHKFFTTKGWVEAKDLKFGNAIFTKIDRLKAYVRSTKRIKLDKKVPVFCGNVNDTHSFFTGDFGIASHNCQNEAAGAQAYSSFDTYMAPYIRIDNLSYKEVKQHLQEFIYNLNVPSRWGTQTPFTNLTFDWVCPEDLKKEKPIVGGKECDFSYGELQKEMDMINKAYIEIMLEGDKNGRVFTFPIPTYNITPDFNWDSENSTLLFEMTAKYGLPYFQNFINSELKPNMIRSMCCRLQLDLRELLKRGNGLFGSAEQTGCYDEETEVLTDRGWKFWRDVTEKDKFYTLSKERKIELQKPTKLFKKKYNGKMISFKTRNLDLLVTPNHNMLIEKEGSLKLVRADFFSKHFWHYGIPKKGLWVGEKKDTITLEGIRSTKYCFGNSYEFTSNTYTFDMKDWVAFVAIFLSEGWVSKSKGRNKDYLFSISQKKEPNRTIIKNLLDRMGIHYNEKAIKNGLAINDKTLHNYLKQFGYQKERFIPRDILSLDKKYLEVFYKWLMLGDGSISKKGAETYYTNSKRLANDVQELIIKLGYGSLIRSRSRLHKEKLLTIYEVSRHVKTDKYWIQNAKKVTEVNYDGMIYCAEVPNHTLMVRRNGKATWCGNSIGVVTINCARLGYLFKGDKESLYKRLDYLMDLARNSLELKRKTLKQNMDRGLYPYIKRWLGTLRNHFSTIGVNGINEMIRNFTNDKEDITTEKGHAFAVEFLDHVRQNLLSYQSEQGTMYNLEATPAEGCFAGDTQVLTIGGAKKIKDLCNKTVAVLSKNKVTRKVEFKRARVFKTGTKPLVKVTFSNGLEIKCTSNHPFAVRHWNGRKGEDIMWVTAEELVKGDRISSVYHKKSDAGYHKLGKGYLHRLIWEYHNHKIPEGYVVHHRDFNKNNNKIANLELMSSADHKAYHIRETQSRGKMLAGSGEDNPFFGKVHSFKSKLQIRFTKSGSSKKRDKYILNLFKHGLSYAQTARLLKCTKEEIQKCIKFYKRNGFNIIGKKPCTYPQWNPEAIEYLDSLGFKSKEIASILKGKNSHTKVRSYIKFLHTKNHKVESVEFLDEVADVYNMEVEDNHNYYVGSMGDGFVLVHNCTYRFAKEDKKRFPDIIQAGTENNPYYTNSSQLPVGYTDDPFEALEMQDDLQRKYTGGTVLHLYMNEAISSSDACKKIVKRALTNFKLPYITITPTFSICPIHGYIKGQHEYCPKCDAELIAKKSSN